MGSSCSVSQTVGQGHCSPVEKELTSPGVPFGKAAENDSQARLENLTASSIDQLARQQSLNFSKVIFAVHKQGSNCSFIGVVETVGNDDSYNLVQLVYVSLKQELSLAIDKHGSKLSNSNLAEQVMKLAIDHIKGIFSRENDVDDKGVTLAILHFDGSETITCCNIGNSEVVCLYPHQPDLSKAVVRLSAKHNWTVAKEADRALASGCEIRKFHLDNVGSVGEDAVWYSRTHPRFPRPAPGLVTSRAVGCSAFRDGGIIDDVSVTRTTVDPASAVVVIASRAVWTIVTDAELRHGAERHWTGGAVDAQEIAHWISTLTSRKWSKYFTEQNIHVGCFLPRRAQSEDGGVFVAERREYSGGSFGEMYTENK